MSTFVYLQTWMNGDHCCLDGDLQCVLLETQGLDMVDLTCDIPAGRDDNNCQNI